MCSLYEQICVQLLNRNFAYKIEQCGSYCQMNNYKQNEELSLDVLNSLKKDSKISQRLLALKLNVSLGTINYCLRELIKKGLVKAENFKNAKNKLAYMYVLTPKGISEKLNLTKKFLLFKQNEYIQIQKEIKKLEAELQEIEKND